MKKQFFHIRPFDTKRIPSKNTAIFQNKKQLLCTQHCCGVPETCKYCGWGTLNSSGIPQEGKKRNWGTNRKAFVPQLL